jgi:hypothetical protein
MPRRRRTPAQRPGSWLNSGRRPSRPWRLPTTIITEISPRHVSAAKLVESDRRAIRLGDLGSRPGPEARHHRAAAAGSAARLSCSAGSEAACARATACPLLSGQNRLRCHVAGRDRQVLVGDSGAAPCRGHGEPRRIVQHDNAGGARTGQGRRDLRIDRHAVEVPDHASSRFAGGGRTARRPSRRYRNIPRRIFRLPRASRRAAGTRRARRAPNTSFRMLSTSTFNWTGCWRAGRPISRPSLESSRSLH